jgi:hypothetical protein
MNIDVYCDEAYPDLFSSEKPHAKFLVIGGLWLKSENRGQFKEAIHSLRDKFHIGGEFKWTKISRSKLDFYKALISWFCDQGEELRVRCIAVDRTQVDLIQFHENDQELGFYKFYYQMLHKWIHDLNEYAIFCDFKRNRRSDRLHVLKSCLERSNLSTNISTVQAVRSRESVLIQLADVLVGLTASVINRRINSGSAKHTLLLDLENFLHRKIAPTALCEKKFNLFKINLQGGW